MVALPQPLIAGTLVRRYKRFLADVDLGGGRVVTAHVANPGSMMGLTAPGLRVWLSHSDDPKRKLAYSWELAEVNGTLVSLNAGRANAVAAEAVAQGTIPELAGYGGMRREVKYGRNSRIDLKLDAAAEGGPGCYVEVKNVHLHRGGGLAEFPDAVTARGTKHLDELAAVAAAGERAVMLYVVQRGDCERFAIADDIDPAYARGLDRARSAGVEAHCYACRITHAAVVVDRRLPIAL
jgi:sugar fermentation stimulation protein A